jgi:aminoglycoside 6-adenylyltransferase
MREQLMTMLVWHVGLKTAFSVSPGYLGKHLKTQLDPELWQLLERTYSDARPNHIWRSLFAMGELFRTVARPVAGTFQFTYPDREDSAVSSFIRRIRSWRR